MATTPYSERLSSNQLTQQTMFSDLLQQRWLIGVGIGMGVLMLLRMRGSDDRQKAAKHLVRDWRHVDDLDDARDLLGSNLPPIVKPALLMVLTEVENQVHRTFRRLERSVEHL